MQALFFASNCESDSSHEQQHHQDDDYQAKATAGTMTLAAAVPPGRQCANQDQDQDD